MSDKVKIILSIVIGLVCAVALFCLIVVIACSVNGLTFSEQICDWFGNNAPAIEEAVEQVTEQTSMTLI